MNYRHVYHAGNFADCFKHSLLITLLDTLGRKPSPYFVLDTHAGPACYDLKSEASRLTAEADDGIKRLLRSQSPIVARYLGLVRQSELYPGSPALIRTVLRTGDRLACCELHPEDALSLRRRFYRDPQVAVHARCGWEALGALLPPREKRGLVFIDPAFEARGEFLTLAAGLQRGYSRFANGIFVAWYPIKHVAAVRDFHAKLVSLGIPDIVVIELHLRDISIPGRLNGCGLAVINPPYQFEDQAYLVAKAVLKEVTDNEVGAGVSVVRLANE